MKRKMNEWEQLKVSGRIGIYHDLLRAILDNGARVEYSVQNRYKVDLWKEEGVYRIFYWDVASWHFGDAPKVYKRKTSRWGDMIPWIVKIFNDGVDAFGGKEADE